mmetsp:Transcript_75502/g.213587  ORF Transcript_75502/g.213587 Transcript_75502/m.213587 type:complete len:209 (-) Transcript_75502:1406-2032(-)
MALGWVQAGAKDASTPAALVALLLILAPEHLYGLPLHPACGAKDALPHIQPLQVAAELLPGRDPRDARPAGLVLVDHERAPSDLVPVILLVPHDIRQAAAGLTRAAAAVGVEAAQHPVQEGSQKLHRKGLHEEVRLLQHVLWDVLVQKEHAGGVAEVVAIMQEHIIRVGGELIAELLADEAAKVSCRAHGLIQLDDLRRLAEGCLAGR